MRMRNFRFLPFVFLLCAFAGCLSACGGATYPKGDLIKDLESLVKKETGEDSKAVIVGKTLYLDMELPGLTSQDQAKAAEAIKKMQNAVMSITRVVLSTDAGTKYAIVSTYDSGKSVLFRIVQDVDDVKNYIYMRISRGDYESRSLIEIEGPSQASVSLDDKHDITVNEFVGRMIVSKINMDARTNPFFGALISALQLRYRGSSDKTLVFTVSSDIDSKTEAFMKGVITEEAKTYSQKYGIETDKVDIVNIKSSALSEINLE